MEFDEHEDQDEDNIEVQLPAPNYEVVGHGRRSGTGGGGYRYRQCLKNHAVGIGGHALDGCGEFMASGDEGTLDALKCAACNCHRNFHKKESVEFHQNNHHLQQVMSTPYYHRPSGYLLVTPPPSTSRPLALPLSTTSREDQEDMSNPSSSGGGRGSGSKKRFRTKFTQEQKEKMLGFAESIGWRIQKQDEAAVQLFCSETGVRRHVLKVWMHNNKHTSNGGGGDQLAIITQQQAQIAQLIELIKKS